MVAAVASPASERANAYQRRRPETTALYEVVRDNLETLYGAIDDGALAVRLPKHAKKELEAFLDCGLLCRGFARLYCASCEHSQLVAFSCKGRGFCPSCMGRRMCATSANLMERVLPETDLRQWVLTFPFAWRRLEDPDDQLAASAVSGQAPPAGPQWRHGLSPLPAAALGYDKALCASLAGFTLHAATRAGAFDPEGRERLLRYVLRPPVAYECIEHRPEGLVRIALKRAFGDGTLAVEMDPLSLLCRLATSVPPPRFHSVKYAGVLAPASAWRARTRPQPEPIAQLAEPSDVEPSSDRPYCYR